MTSDTVTIGTLLEELKTYFPAFRNGTTEMNASVGKQVGKLWREMEELAIKENQLLWQSKDLKFVVVPEETANRFRAEMLRLKQELDMSKPQQ